MSTPRKQIHVGLFGAQGCGKTTFMIEKAVKYYRETKKRVLFLIPDDQEEKLDRVPEITEKQLFSFTGIAKMIVSYSTIQSMRNYYLPEPGTVPTHIAKLRKFNGMKCYDDPGSWLPRSPEDFYQLTGRRRQINFDMISAFPGLKKKAPARYYGYLTHLELWQTTDSPMDLCDELPPDKQEQFLKLYQYVQFQAQDKPHYHLGMVLRKVHPDERCPAFDPGGILYEPKPKIHIFK